MTKLNITLLGESGPRVAFCHGLFGQGKNWQQHGKTLAAEGYRVALVDMPNHGQSPWTKEFSYRDMAEMVVADLREISDGEPWTLIGHSMGGKTVMMSALLHPDFVEKLVVVDMSPVQYDNMREFAGYIRGMLAMDTAAIESRQHAHKMLTPHVASETIRGFMLQNLRRGDDGFSWQVNLELLGNSLPLLGAWDSSQLPSTPYEGPVLWIAGAKSPYVKPEYADAMRAHFPHTRLVTIKNAGHWVHSEQPEVFLETVRRFLAA